MVRGLAVLGLLLAACGVPHPTEEERIGQTLGILASAPAGAFDGRLLSLRTREFATFGDLLGDAAAARVVYVGETHPDPAHHAFGETLVRALREYDPRLAVGLEMFPRGDQAALDAYVSGAIDEEELVLRTGCAKRWGPAWILAAPLLRFARETRTPLVALDLDPEIARRIGREGLEGLPPEVRAGLPIGPVMDEDVRRLALAHDLDLPRETAERDRLAAAMSARDDVMADRIVGFLESPAGRSRRLVVLAGSGHVRDGFGIPPRLARRTGWPQLTVVAEEVEASAGDREWRRLVTGDLADYVLITRRERRP